MGSHERAVRCAEMRTLLPDPPPAPFDRLLAERERRGADRRDEVWEGVLHLAPAPHWRHGAIQGQLLELLGPPARAQGLIAVGDMNLGDAEDYRVPDAALTGPDPDPRTVQWLALAEGGYAPVERSAIIDLSADQLAERIDWPA